MAKADPDRVFNPHGRRHYRRTYSTLEVRLGLSILAALVVVAGWVYQRGQHPDPDLFGAGVGLEPAAESDLPERGPMPTDLVSEGYREGRLSRFGPDNLFEKINGRADFFKSRGFVALTFLTLQHGDPNLSVDVELYDMGNAQNALGTYASERAPEVTPERVAGAQFHREPNALFMARGQFYVRATAASDAPPVDAQLERLKARLNQTIEGAQGPWSEALFVAGLGLPASAVGFVTENAFSFGFARGVHVATLTDGDTQLFVVPTASGDAAAALSARFSEGFQSYGEANQVDGQTFVADRYLKRVSAAASEGPFTVGVVSAEDQAAAAEWLTKLHAAIAALPDAVVTRALSELPGAPQDTAGLAEGVELGQAYEDDDTDDGPAEGTGEPAYE